MDSPPFAVASIVVSHRPPGEDRLAVLPLPDGGLVVVVADGAGGQGGGARAAELVVELVEGAIKDAAFLPHDLRSWVALLVEADEVIEREPMAGETTAVVLAVSGVGRIVGASVGDSEGWVVSSEGRAEDLTAGQKRKRLGSGETMPMEFERQTFEGTLVIGTDGLFKYAPAAVISSAAKVMPIEAAVEQLVGGVRLPSGELQDDVAVVLVRPRS